MCITLYHRSIKYKYVSYFEAKPYFLRFENRGQKKGDLSDFSPLRDVPSNIQIWLEINFRLNSSFLNPRVKQFLFFFLEKF